MIKTTGRKKMTRYRKSQKQHFLRIHGLLPWKPGNIQHGLFWLFSSIIPNINLRKFHRNRRQCVPKYFDGYRELIFCAIYQMLLGNPSLKLIPVQIAFDRIHLTANDRIIIIKIKVLEGLKTSEIDIWTFDTTAGLWQFNN